MKTILEAYGEAFLYLVLGGAFTGFFVYLFAFFTIS